jgi:phosphate starvation-inducible protein PhoH
MERRTSRKKTSTEDVTVNPKSKKEFIGQFIKKQTKEKFLTENQRLYYNILKQDQITICTGPAGVGKSYIAMKAAVDLLQDPNNSEEKNNRTNLDFKERLLPYIVSKFDTIKDKLNLI